MTDLAIHEDKPVPGYYKFRRHKEARWQPCAIWLKDGKLVCRIADRMVDPHEVWTWVADNKVHKLAAKFAFENGHFPDEPAPLPVRSNMPSDPFDALKVEIEDKRAQAEAWLKAHPEIKSQADSDLARNYQAELLALNKRADAMFTAEKAPLLTATRACDEKYRFRAVVTDIADRLRKLFGRFMAAEEARLKAEAEAKFRADQARIAAERAAIEAAAKKKMADDPIAALTESPPEMPELPLLPDQVKIQAGGGVGRKAGLRSEWVPHIVDYDAALAHFAQHPDIRTELERLVRHVVKDSKGTAKIPGVKITETRVPA